MHLNLNLKTMYQTTFNRKNAYYKQNGDLWNSLFRQFFLPIAYTCIRRDASTDTHRAEAFVLKVEEHYEQLLPGKWIQMFPLLLSWQQHQNLGHLCQFARDSHNEVRQSFCRKVIET